MKTIFVDVLAFAIGVTAANLRAQVITLGPASFRSTPDKCSARLNEFSPWEDCAAVRVRLAQTPALVNNYPTPCARWLNDIECATPSPLPRPTPVQFPKATITASDEGLVQAFAIGLDPNGHGWFVRGRNGGAVPIRVDAQGRVECAR